ncbi:TNT domain-containing protein [Kineococcus sp. SYSU DK002]|uniref:TNT domain-containing protein n=1 Tax=Kineococcus sp. SYSU DK002 TaxID=3383123 RepID=UPI003D7C9918
MRLVEINPDAVRGVERDVRATRDELLGTWSGLRTRARSLGVAPDAFDDLLVLADGLDQRVLPVVAEHRRRAEDLAALRYSGRFGQTLTVVDGTAAPAPAGLSPAFEPAGTTTRVTWAPGSDDELDLDDRVAAAARSVTDWLGGTVERAEHAVREGFERVAHDVTTAWRTGAAVADVARDRVEATLRAAATIAPVLAEQTWDTVRTTATTAWHAAPDVAAALWDAAPHAVVAAVADAGRRWDEVTGEAGEWVDGHLAGVRDWIGEHVGAFRWVAKALRIVGWVVVAIGAVLTVALAVAGALGVGVVVGAGTFGVGAVPGGLAGALAGAQAGMLVVGAGFTLVSAGDFLDVLADWGEGTIDGQDLMQRGAGELAMAATSLIGVGAIAKGGQKLFKHLPTPWRQEIDRFLDRYLHPTGTYPTVGGQAAGRGWTRAVEEELTAREKQYGHDVGDGGTAEQAQGYLAKQTQPWATDLGADPAHPWGKDPVTGAPLTQEEWAARYLHQDGSRRWPPNDGAVPGTKILYDDLAAFKDTFGSRFDRIGPPTGGYLGIPPGTPYGDRALPPYTMGADLHEYSLGGEMPDWMRIEVSEIAPAFGQPGGGRQVRFMDTRNDAEVSVEDLKRMEVLK